MLNKIFKISFKTIQINSILKVNNFNKISINFILNSENPHMHTKFHFPINIDVCKGKIPSLTYCTNITTTKTTRSKYRKTFSLHKSMVNKLMKISMARTAINQKGVNSLMKITKS